ncbi:MAG TPA: hypothetical protein VHY09_08390 [Candidatus Methylacidiphilales bacterium]|jgi:hypothetical protein|nr:hypothetical protein [Candidatus Methylacidiphilales bacterium]
MPPANLKPTGSRVSWFWPWCAVLIAAAAVLTFRHLTLPAPKQAVATDVPFVRVLLGADLWTYFDSSLLDRTPRRFPAYSVDPVESRGMLEIAPKVQPDELLVLVQAERFLSEEFLRQPGEPPGVHVAAGPFLRECSLALVMSKETRAQILKTTPAPPNTLLVWLNACTAASRPGQPITFYMADPNQCSASWIGLSELVAEQMGNLDQKQLGAVADEQLSQALSEMGRQVTIQGVSDRLELFKLLLGRYRPGAVLLTYDHLAAPLQQGYTGDYTFIVPEKHFHPVVQALLLTRIASLDTARYLPTLLHSWSDCGLIQDAFRSQVPTPLANDENRVPPYATMRRILEAWNSRSK